MKRATMRPFTLHQHLAWENDFVHEGNEGYYVYSFSRGRHNDEAPYLEGFYDWEGRYFDPRTMDHGDGNSLSYAHMKAWEAQTELYEDRRAMAVDYAIDELKERRSDYLASLEAKGNLR